jgi:flagellar biogenesis protein FliO
VIFSYLLTLVGVCGLAVGVLVVLRAAKRGGLALGGAQPIRVVGRQAVGAGSALMLVEVDGQRLLIGVSRSGIAVLEGKAAAPSNVVLIESGFHATLRRAGERW